jgi:hypothetical protein
VIPKHTQNLLQLHDARVGSDVVDRVGGLGLIDIFLVKDIVEGKRLLRDSHDGQRICAAARKHKNCRGERKG